MPTIKYVGALSSVVMDVHGRSEPGDEDNIVQRDAPFEVTEDAAAALCDGLGACWERAAAEPVEPMEEE